MEAVVQAQEQAALALDRGILRGIVITRWMTIVYAVVGVILERDHLVHPNWATAGLSAAVLFTLFTTVLVERQPQLLLTAGVIGIEFALGITLLLADGWVYDDLRGQSLPWAWPAISLITAGVAWGPIAGAIGAVIMSIASFVGQGLNNGGDRWTISSTSKLGLYLLAAVGAGYVARRLREAERAISAARAREDIARTLHDGVLQTLAVVQRRSDDPELAMLARQQDRELRDYLFGVQQEIRTLPVALRETAARFTERHGTAAGVIVAEDMPAIAPEVVEAVAGAVGEALTNADKHGQASRITVFAEPEDEAQIFCSVKDDGQGFDPNALSSPHAGQGISRSIKGRVAEVGGTVEISSKPGRGTEVRIRVPVKQSRS